jgi:hypothetical protein
MSELSQYISYQLSGLSDRKGRGNPTRGNMCLSIKWSRRF